MIPLNKNKCKLLAFFIFPYQFATATSVAPADNYNIKTNTTLTVNNRDAFINHIGPNENSQLVTSFYSSYPICYTPKNTNTYTNTNN